MNIFLPDSKGNGIKPGTVQYPTDPINKLDLTGMLSADAYQKWHDNGQKMIPSLTGRVKSLEVV